MGGRRFRRRLDPTEINEVRALEIAKCYKSPVYFANNYCQIYDSVTKSWIPFKLWPEQKAILRTIASERLVIILKARQLGISWVVLAYALWEMMYRPIASVSVFSRREEESKYLLGQERLRGMFNHLPAWMRTGHETKENSYLKWQLTTESVARAFPTSAGDSYVSTLAIVDEADLAPDLNHLLGAVKPTVDNGGKLILLSRTNKKDPESEFKSIYRAALTGENDWHQIFLPWSAHPGRDADWYRRQKRDIYSRTGSLDDLYEQYPETPEQALSAATLDKRIPPIWVESCFEEWPTLSDSNAPGISKLAIYKKPQPGVRYVIGADAAEGNPNSDDSSLTVVDVDSGEEQACLAGKYEPSIFGDYISQVSAYYNNAAVLVERNNHGHAVIQWLEEHARRINLLLGHDAETHKKDKKNRRRRKTLKRGWVSSTRGKAILYTYCVEHFQVSSDAKHEFVAPKKVVHNRSTMVQLLSIESSTLLAPRGQNEDRADSYALAQAGRKQMTSRAHSSATLTAAVGGWV